MTSKEKIKIVFSFNYHHIHLNIKWENSNKPQLLGSDPVDNIYHN